MSINNNLPDEPPRDPKPEVPPPIPERAPPDPVNVPVRGPDVIFPGQGEPIGIPTGPGPEIPSAPPPPEIV